MLNFFLMLQMEHDSQNSPILRSENMVSPGAHARAALAGTSELSVPSFSQAGTPLYETLHSLMCRAPCMIKGLFDPTTIRYDVLRQAEAPAIWPENVVKVRENCARLPPALTDIDHSKKAFH